MKHAIIILGHGSRNADANAEFQMLVAKIAAVNAGEVVLAAYLELCEPRLAASLQVAIEQGATTIRVVPCLLFTGYHVSKDIPKIVAEFQQMNPQIAVTVAEPIGLDPLLLEIILQRIKE